MDEIDVEAFDKFIEKHWSRKKETVAVSAEPVEVPKKRGRRKKLEE